jgi:Zn-dependent peptidase ImmA (M78 family)
MDTQRSHPRRLSDPDLRALLRSHGDSVDAYDIVRDKAAALLARFEDFEDDSPTPLDRIMALASVAGLPVQAAQGNMSAKGRAAIFISVGKDGRGSIVYDATLPASRILFSIAHEIVHSFIPSSTAGVRFRSMHSPTSKQSRELEMLCEFGAALLIMPEGAFMAAVARHGFGLANVDQIRRQFGSSFEATTYRVAQTARFAAAAAKLKYRLSKQQQQVGPSSGFLFPLPDREAVKPKYRCQSFHRSGGFPGRIPFNKSFPENSCVYEAASAGEIQSAVELIPVPGQRPVRARIEAVRAPYQPDDADTDHPDVLVLMRVVSG